MSDEEDYEDGESKSVNFHLARKCKADADKAELNVAILKKKYVSVEEVKKTSFNIGRLLRDNLMNIPDRLASILANEDNEKIILIMLQDEIREVLENISSSRMSWED